MYGWQWLLARSSVWRQTANTLRAAFCIHSELPPPPPSPIPRSLYDIVMFHSRESVPTSARASRSKIGGGGRGKSRSVKYYGLSSRKNNTLRCPHPRRPPRLRGVLLLLRGVFTKLIQGTLDKNPRRNEAIRQIWPSPRFSLLIAERLWLARRNASGVCECTAPRIDSYQEAIVVF